MGEISEQVLTARSVSVGAGASLGGYVVERETDGRDVLERRADRDRVLAETTWVDCRPRDPVMQVVVEQLAELEGADPPELDPLDRHVDPALLAELNARDDSHWQFPSTPRVKVRVSSRGTAAVYDCRR